MKKTGIFLGLAIIGITLVGIGQKPIKSASEQENSENGYKGLFEAERLAYYKRLESKPWADVAQKQIKMLQEEEKGLMAELFKLAGITPEIWQAGLKGSSDFYDNQIKEMMTQTKEFEQSALKTLVETTLAKFDLDAKDISIVHSIGGQDGNLMSVMKSHVCINESKIEDMKKNRNVTMQDIKGALAHEIQHLLHDDSFMYSHIKAALAAYNVEIKVADDFLNKYNIFKEKRADIMAGLADPEFAQGLTAMLKILDAPYEKDGAIVYLAQVADYPNLSQRVNYLSDLSKNMKPSIA